MTGSQDLVLNVDDQEPQRYVKTRDLRATGFVVIEAVSGGEALRIIEKEMPAVVLLDVQLPDINGYEVCRYIKKRWPYVMVLMTSATFTTSQRRIEGLDAGADSFLVQPAEPLELAAAVNALLRIRRSEDELRKLNAALGGQVEARTAELSRAIAALKSSADRMRALLQTTYILQGYMAPDGTLLDTNRASLDSIEGKLDDVIGRPLWETPWFTGTPGIPELVREAVARAVTGSATEQSIVLALPTGERAFDMALRPVKSEGSRVIGIVFEAVETTQRLKAEEALRQSQKMEAIGQLTGGIAHDFNNLLTAVVGNLDLIRLRSSEPNVQRWANNAFHAAERGTKLTGQLLAFSRTQKLDAVPIDVNGLIGGMHDLLKQSLGANIEVRLELAAGAPPVRADANQLELAILNLSLNARDAMPDGGVLTIRTAPGKSDTVFVAVTDTGTGMPPDVAARAFDPFFTTKPTGKGTGLGLSQVYGFARRSGGSVAIASEVERGTTVSMYLPRSPVAPAQAAQPSAEQMGGRQETILIVEDNPDVRAVAVMLLEQLGYRTVTADSGPAALHMLGTDPRVDLVFTDVVLPGAFDGLALAQSLGALRPDLPVVLTTGYAKRLDDDPGFPVLRKPYDIAALARVVREAIDVKPGVGEDSAARAG